MPETLEGFVPPRRLPSHDREIANIGKDDVRIRLFGIVIDKKDNVIVLDDGTGKINVVFAEPVETEVNKRVRVFGRVMPMEEGFEIQGEILHDMSGVDPELYKKVRDLERE